MSQPAVQQIVEAAERRTLTIEMIEAAARNTQRVGRKELASALKTASRSMPTLVDQACRTSAVTKDRLGAELVEEVRRHTDAGDIPITSDMTFDRIMRIIASRLREPGYRMTG